jgi:hypothetical protein
MALERYFPNPSPAEGVEVIGGVGNVGGKFDQLIQKTPELNRIGFRTPQRIILPEEFFDSFLSRNGLGKTLRQVPQNEATISNILNGNFSREDFETIKGIVERFGDTPIVVRSSAAGDSRGTGIYRSEFTDGHVGNVRKAIQRVLASYFTPDAIQFRQDAKTGEGFALGVEPAIGSWVEEEWGFRYFTPIISGFGYTSTLRDPDGYVVTVPGLGGGVETRGGERLTPHRLQESMGELGTYVYLERDKIFWGRQPLRNSSLLGIRGGRTEHDARVFLPKSNWEKAGLHDTSFDGQSVVGRGIQDTNLLPLFEMMKDTEKSFGKPQYLEWAVTIKDENATFWIIQISDVERQNNAFEIHAETPPLLEAHSVTGNGKADCKRILIANSHTSAEAIGKYNSVNEDYILVYPSTLVSRGQGLNRFNSHARELGYHDINKARVILERQNAQHATDPLAHFQGQLDLTGKFFGVLDLDMGWDENYEQLLENAVPIAEGVFEMQGNFQVQSSERENRLLILQIQDK